MEAKHALVRRPSPHLGDGLVTHIERTPVDSALALQQWQDYVAALESAGWTVHQVDPAPELADSAFVEDTMVVYGDLAVIARPGADQRKPETTAAERAVAAQGYRIAHITEPGTLDGGDVLKSGGTVWVGRGGRTNAAGIAQLRDLLSPLGAEVVAVDLTKVLHLKSAVTALADGTVIGYPPLVDDPDVWAGRFREVPEEPGAHVVLLGEDQVLLSASAPATADLLRAEGYRVITVDISEFEKLEGCVTCLSVRLRGRPEH